MDFVWRLDGLAALTYMISGVLGFGWAGTGDAISVRRRGRTARVWRWRRGLASKSFGVYGAGIWGVNELRGRSGLGFLGALAVARWMFWMWVWMTNAVE